MSYHYNWNTYTAKMDVFISKRLDVMNDTADI